MRTPPTPANGTSVKVTYLPVQRGSGLVDLGELEAAIRPDTVACSVMAVNNEIGVVQPLKEIGEICRKNKVFFHSDIAQMLGKVCRTGGQRGVWRVVIIASIVTCLVSSFLEPSACSFTC